MTLHLIRGYGPWMLLGFYLDRPVNALGSTGWDWLGDVAAVLGQGHQDRRNRTAGVFLLQPVLGHPAAWPHGQGQWSADG